jgi:hypothetical protein
MVYKPQQQTWDPSLSARVCDQKHLPWEGHSTLNILALDILGITHLAGGDGCSPLNLCPQPDRPAAKS